MRGEELREIVLSEPTPLFCGELQLGLLYSAKSGSSYGVKWFFAQMGFLKAALHYHSNVHYYRETVFNRSPVFQQEVTRIVDEVTRTVRLVREPYTRCVSSFLHAVRFGYVDEQLSAFLRRPVNRESGLSFREFLDFLESQDLRHCDGHIRVQAHELELSGLVLPTAVIHLENARESFRSLEREWGLESIDPDSLRSSRHHTIRGGSASFCGDRVYSLQPSDPTELPPARAFYDSGLRDRVRRLYAGDFDRYGYDPDVEL